MVIVRKWVSRKLPTDYFFPIPNPPTWLVTPLLLHLALQFYFQLFCQSWEGKIVRDERERLGATRHRLSSRRENKKPEFIPAGKWISAEIGRHWPECPERAEMGRNLIRGGMEGIIIPVYTPVNEIHNIAIFTIKLLLPIKIK